MRRAGSGILPSRRLLAKDLGLAVSLAVRAAPGLFACHVLLSLLSAGLPVSVAWCTKLLIDRLAAHDAEGALACGGGLALAGLAATLLPQLSQYVQAQMERSITLLAQVRLYRAVDGLVGLGRFEDPRFLDRLRLAQQAGGGTPAEMVQGGVGIFESALTMIGFVLSLAILNSLMAFVVVASAVPALIAELALSRRRAGVQWEIGPLERRELFFRQLLSNVKAAKEIRLFGIGGFLRDRMCAERISANEALRRMDRKELAIQGFLGLLSATIAGLGFWWAVIAAVNGRLTIGDLSMFIAAVASIQASGSRLVSDISRTYGSLLLFDHYREVLNVGPDLELRAEAKRTQQLKHGIFVEDVWFRYSADHPWILQGLSLEIPYGRAVGLVGLNGAGKSTLVKLLCRLYDPDRGRILWDGTDLRDLSVEALRERISSVFQDYMSYDMTATENVGLGDLGSLNDSSRIMNAARLAGVHEKICELPAGYETLLSRLFFGGPADGNEELGVVLSGGQWQRLAIARALLRDRRDLLILDEPSSGLDAEAEYEIHSRLKEHRSGWTTLLISHRLAAIRDADIIVVLSGGKVAEHGTHDVLMGQQGIYARLFTLQADRYQMYCESATNLPATQ